MHYSVAVPFTGNVVRAFDTAIAALTGLGFRIESQSGTSLDLTGPGMTSTKQNALLGASRIRLGTYQEQLSVEAELGGVEWMSRFVRWFPVGLNLAISLVLLAVFAVVFPQAIQMVALVTLGVATANILVWLVIAPILTRHMRTRSCRALDALASNMATVARDG